MEGVSYERYGGWPRRGTLCKVGIISLSRYPFLDNLPQEGSLQSVSLSLCLGKPSISELGVQRKTLRCLMCGSK